MSEEKMEAFSEWLPTAYRDGDVGDEAKFTKHNMEVAFSAGAAWQAALQESEAGAVAYILRNEYDEYRLEPLEGLNIKQFPVEQEIKLYPAPQSAQAIETAAIIKCVEVCDRHAHSTWNDDRQMSLLDTVEPDIYAAIPILGGHTVEDAYFRHTVESMLSQCRKEALLEAVDRFAGRGILYGYTVADELRRMAEPDKTTMEGEKHE